MSRKIFIGNLPDRADGRDVEDFFRGCGRIVEISLKDGYGFVEFEDSRDAEDAVYDLHGERLCGERLTIEMARGGQDSSRSERSGRSDRPHRTDYAVWVDNLSSRCRFVIG